MYEGNAVPAFVLVVDIQDIGWVMITWIMVLSWSLVILMLLGLWVGEFGFWLLSSVITKLWSHC